MRKWLLNSGTSKPHDKCTVTSNKALAQVIARRGKDSAQDLVFDNWDMGFHIRGCPHSWGIKANRDEEGRGHLCKKGNSSMRLTHRLTSQINIVGTPASRTVTVGKRSY